MGLKVFLRLLINDLGWVEYLCNWSQVTLWLVKSYCGDLGKMFEFCAFEGFKNKIYSFDMWQLILSIVVV
jgi:hypothetical protein